MSFDDWGSSRTGRGGYGDRQGRGADRDAPPTRGRGDHRDEDMARPSTMAGRGGRAWDDGSGGDAYDNGGSRGMLFFFSSVSSLRLAQARGVEASS